MTVEPASLKDLDKANRSKKDQPDQNQGQSQEQEQNHITSTVITDQIAPPKVNNMPAESPSAGHIPMSEDESLLGTLISKPLTDTTAADTKEQSELERSHTNGVQQQRQERQERNHVRAGTPKHVSIVQPEVEEEEQDQQPHHLQRQSTPLLPSPSFPTDKVERGHVRHDSPHSEALGQDDNEEDVGNVEEDVDMEVDNNSHQQLSDEKYKRLKRKLKEVLEENERMGQELFKSHRRVKNLRREKNLLLDRLCTLDRQDSDSGSDSGLPLSSDSDSSEGSIMEEIPLKRAPQIRSAGRGRNARGSPAAGSSAATPGSKKAAAKAVSSTSTTGRSTKEPKSQGPAVIPSTITNVGSATQKPKRVHQTNKQRPGLAKARKVQALERDETGNIKLPVTIGIITLLDIGHVVFDREAFHNDRYIWPVGYKMSRSYNSMIDPQIQTTYTCSVIDDGEAPKFQIDAEDQPGKPIIAGTATGAWTHVVKAANAIRKRDHSNSASGPDYFGFSNATIAKLIQDLPNVDKCHMYIMQRFEEPAPASATGTAKGGDKKKSPGKTSAPKTKERDEDAGADEAGAAEEEEDEGEDDDAYTTLGSGKEATKVQTSAPWIRNAGFDALSVQTSQKQESMTVHYDTIKDDDDGDETHSEEDPTERKHSISALAPSAAPASMGAVHSISTADENQSRIDVTTGGDSEVIDIEDHDSEVDIGGEEEETRTAPENGGMAMDESMAAHHSI
ncbi:hypothetical protein BG011_006492 [Mortierella polycephala]|uniref:INO80 complex subunit E N-terminal domain-containing protein n=1 Tax=Mortierella polycephala TaxID=41804 RepID=A0A9P6TZH1_9FUNG|nr:hypothetical protein BG011_006492 [Mortierella polycephala]